MKYKVFFPVTSKMSPIDYVVSDKPMESKEEEALWFYNNSRDHDGLSPLSALPRGTRFEAIECRLEEDSEKCAAFNAQFEEWNGDSDGSVGVD